MIKSKDLLNFQKFIKSQNFLSGYSANNFEDLFYNLDFKNTALINSWNTVLTIDNLKNHPRWHLFGIGSEILIYQARDFSELMDFVNKLKTFFSYTKTDLSWNYFGNQITKDKYWDYLYNWFWTNQNKLTGQDQVFGSKVYQEILTDISKLLAYFPVHNLDFMLPVNFWTDEIYNFWLNISKNLGSNNFKPTMSFNTISNLHIKISNSDYNVYLQLQKNYDDQLVLLVLI